MGIEAVSFTSAGVRCAAWHATGDGDAFATPAGRPCVVLAHGIGGTVDSGLLPYVERFSEAGLDALAFDYRGFGASEGEPRQFVSFRCHREDYHAAIAFARTLPGVDPERIVLFGTSYSGGHVIAVAAADPRVAAVVAQTPGVDIAAAVIEIARYGGVRQLGRVVALGVKDQIGSRLGRPPVTIPLVGRPGEVAAMTTDDAYDGYTGIAGPSWRNEMLAREMAVAGLNRAITVADQIRCPVLVIAADRDTVVPPATARKVVWKMPGRGELRTYPCGHFDLYTGEWFDRGVADMLAFITRHLAPSRTTATA